MHIYNLYVNESPRNGKKKCSRKVLELHPEIAEYFRELAVDFCVRFPEEATRQRETREWEQQESAFSPKKNGCFTTYI